jgi:hypothetical protein
MNIMKSGSLRFRIDSPVSLRISRSFDFSQLENTSLNNNDDYKKTEKTVLECAGYLLDSPIESIEKDLDLLGAMQFILRWAEGTPYILFMPEERIIKAFGTNTCLFGLYLASLAKFAIENKRASPEEIRYYSLVILLDYISRNSKSFSPENDLAIMIEAKKHNLLKEYLSISTGNGHAGN